MKGCANPPLRKTPVFAGVLAESGEGMKGFADSLFSFILKVLNCLILIRVCLYFLLFSAPELVKNHKNPKNFFRQIKEGRCKISGNPALYK